jgi:NDP-sugar pyrophosphorylase family protein
VPRDQTGNYGIVAVETEKSGAQRVKKIVEKPKPADAPSNLAVVGRYILTPAIFAKLRRTQHGAGGEIQLTDGIAALLADEPVHVLPFTGIRYDCGSKIGYLRRRSSTLRPSRAWRQLPGLSPERLGALTALAPSASSTRPASAMSEDEVFPDRREARPPRAVPATR